MIKVQLFIIILKLFADRFCKRNFSLKLRIKLLFIPLKQIKLSFSKVTMLYRALCYTVHILYRTALGVCLYLVKILNTNRTNTIALYSYARRLWSFIIEDS